MPYVKCPTCSKLWYLRTILNDQTIEEWQKKNTIAGQAFSLQPCSLCLGNKITEESNKSIQK